MQVLPFSRIFLNDTDKKNNPAIQSEIANVDDYKKNRFDLFTTSIGAWGQLHLSLKCARKVSAI